MSEDIFLPHPYVSGGWLLMPPWILQTLLWPPGSKHHSGEPEAAHELLAASVFPPAEYYLRSSRTQLGRARCYLS